MSKKSLIALGLALALAGCGDDDDGSPSSSSGGLSVSCNATPTSGVVPLSVQFSATVAGADDDGTPALAWSFGDGTAASAGTAARTYAAPGTYTAVAEAHAGGRSSSCSVSITARPAPVTNLPPNQPPVAQFKTNPTPPTGPAPLTVTFNACQTTDAEGDKLLFRFDVQDGLGPLDTNHCRREYTYRTRGRYQTKMCVTDQDPRHDDICQSYTVRVN